MSEASTTTVDASLTGSAASAATAVQARADRDVEHRRMANRAVAVSAVGLAATGVIELAVAIFTGSVGLLSDALHNLPT